MDIKPAFCVLVGGKIPPFFYIQEIPIDNIDSNKAAKKPLQKPSTSIPGAKYAAKRNKSAFINKIDIPRVKILIGKATNIKAGFINVLTQTIIIEAIIALVKLEILIPGIIYPINKSANDKAINFKNIVNIFIVSTKYLYGNSL